MAAYFFGAAVPEVHAWDISVNPKSRSTVPGGTVTYTVSVFYDTPTDALFPSVLLLVSPPDPHVSVTFTYDNPDPHPPPYTATMTVHVDNSKPPGTYTLYLWANPSGTPFPGPGNREMDVELVVVAGGQVHLSVPHSPLSVGQPVYIEYYTDPGADGMITLMITRPPLLAIFWTKGPEPITGGLLYDVTTPGFDTPGTYHVGATVELSGGGSINGETTFKVGAGGVFGFTIALSPGSVEVNQGETAHYKILLTYSDPSYSGTDVNIQLSGLGSGMDWHLTEAGDLTVRTSTTTPTGTYTITAIGSAMGVVHQTSAVLLVQSAEQSFDFSIMVSPSQQTVSPGGSTSYTVTVSLVSGDAHRAAVELSVSGAPAGVSASFDPLYGTATFTSTMKVTTDPSATPGTSTLTVTGKWWIAQTGETRTHTAPVTLIISQAGDFRVEASPPSQTVLQGQTASYSVHVVGLNGFNSQISLTVNGLPAGLNGVFSIPSSAPDYSSTLTLTIPSNSPTGSFTLTITGSGGGITRTANVVLNVNPSQTQTQTTAQTATTQTAVTPTAAPGDVLGMLQQNSLLIIAALAILVILFAALSMRGRGRRPAPQQTGPQRLYCPKCGTENPAGNEFCANCGQRLG